MALARFVRLVVGGCALAVLVGSAPGLAAGRSGWVRGWVHDPAGRRIEGAEVKVGQAAGQRTLLTAATNGSGEFFLAGLAPGLYVLTAHKEGYATATSRLNTLAESSITLTLAPLLGEMRPEGSEPAALPPDRSWVLRQPRHDLLREQGIEVATAADPFGAGSGASTAVPDSEDPAASQESEGFRLDGHLEQLFALGGGDGTGGLSSRIDLGATLDPGFELTLSGESSRRALDEDRSSDFPEKEFDERLARLGARLDPRPSDTLEVSALLGRRSYSLLSEAPGAEEGYDQEVRGYGARWERDLGALGSMDVAFDFRSVEVAGGGSGDFDRPTPFEEAENQVWEATGSYHVDLTERRQMHVGLRARRLLLERPGAVAVSVLDGAGGLPGAPGEGAWALDLSGREQMSLDGPLSLDYGFSYHRHAGDRSSSEEISDAFIPEAGLTVTQPDGPRWSAAISLALDRPQERGVETLPPAAGDASEGLLSRVGYRLGMDYPMRRLGLNVSVNATYRPYAYAPPGDDGTPLDIRTPLRRSLMISEGNAESLEVGLRLEKRFRSFVAALGSQIGQVEGYLVTGYFDEIPVQQVSYNLVRYMVASVRGYQPRSGTLVHVDYQRYLNNPEQAFDPASLSYLHERVDVALEQDLPFVDLWNARWRVLLALQSLHTDALNGAELASLREAGVRESERRFSGGLAIRF